MKLRSKIPRRKRTQISPILLHSNTSRSIVSSHLTGQQLSCYSSRISANQQKPPPKKRSFADTLSADVENFRRITRSYQKKLDNNVDVAKVLEVSESSCVDSCLSGAGDIISKFESKTAEIPKQINKYEGESLDYNNQTDVVSATSGLDCLSEAKIGNKLNEFSEVSNCGSNAEGIVGKEYDLLCEEDNNEEYYSEIQSDVYEDISSDYDFSDYNSSLWSDSGSQFSEKSVNDATSSPTYQLLLQFRLQFYRSSFCANLPSNDAAISDEVVVWRFDDEDHEASYQMIRSRERKQIYLHDYADEYCSNTDYGDLVIQQRLQMVHWIIEQSSNKELQRETMFLGVNLFDRFLSKGHFKNKRNLQIAAIACLALATRIEENQPFNSVRQKTIYVGSTGYSRYEVVAMEWLVQEVLNFQCYLPTVYNFLWFYLKAARANEEMEKTAKYIAVLALLGHEQLCYWPSTVAAGLVILASLAANQDAACHRVTEIHVRTKDDNLPGCVKSMERLMTYV